MAVKGTASVAPIVGDGGIVDALLGLRENRPPHADGWRSMDELKKETGLAEPTLRRLMKKLNGKTEKQAHQNHMYYRIKDGSK